MARLTAADRSMLPSSAFALPELREFPLVDRFGRLDHGHITAAFGRILGSARGLTVQQKVKALKRTYSALARYNRNDLQHLMRRAGAR